MSRRPPGPSLASSYGARKTAWPTCDFLRRDPNRTRWSDTFPSRYRVRDCGRPRERREGRGGEGGLDVAEHFAARGDDDFRCVRLERLAKHVVRYDEKPGLAALLDNCPTGPYCHRISVVRVVDVVGRALLSLDRR